MGGEKPGVERAAEELVSDPLCVTARLHSLVKNPSEAGVLKGHDFNRAAKAIESTPDFSP
jgi:hypothetical protein